MAAPTPNTAVLSARDVRVTYPTAIHALNGVSVSIRRGEFVALIGPNGSGKSTLLRCLAGLLKPDSGSLEIDGLSAHAMKPLERARRVACVPALSHAPEFMTALIPPP